MSVRPQYRYRLYFYPTIDAAVHQWRAGCTPPRMIPLASRPALCYLSTAMEKSTFEQKGQRVSFFEFATAYDQ